MATYKPIRKTASGTEEIKIPYAVLADAPDLSKYVTTDGGTINKSKTIKMDASANSNGANLKWGTVNHKNPYIGYASDQVDGTFVVGSLLGTNYASGLAIGGGSGNLLWKGAKVATTNDIPAAVTESTVSGWGFTKNTGTVTSVAVKMNGETKGTVTSSGTIDLGTVLNEEEVKDIKVKNAANADVAGEARKISYNMLFEGYKHLGNGAMSETFMKYDGSDIRKLYFGDEFQFLNADGAAQDDGNKNHRLTLKPTGVAAGTYNSVTVDAKGRVTAGTNTPAVDTSNLAKLDTENTFRTPSEILSEANGVPKSAFSLEGTTLTITI